MMNALAITAALALATAALEVQARPMHEAIRPHYARYLQEQDDVALELDAWLNKFKSAGDGVIPKSEARSADEEKEDQMQRFFLTKERIKELEKENPDAKFSTDSPFTLMTDDEFNTYVGNAYRKVEDDPVSRSLRGMQNSGSHSRGKKRSSRASNYQDRSGESKTKGSGWSYQSSWNRDSNGKKKETATWSGAVPAEWLDWWNQVTVNHSNNNNNYKPVTVAPYNPDTAAPQTAAPETAAPQTAAPQTATPETAAPETAAPAAADSDTSEPVVAPEETQAPAAEDNSNNLPVAPEDNAGYDFDTVTTEAPIAAEADVSSGKIDWSTTACVSKIQNQGQCGSCWAFASIAAVESAQCIAGGQKGITKYSEQQLASCDGKNYGCNGGAPVYAFDYIKKNGVCSEDAYPYTSTNGRIAECTASCQKLDPGIKGSAKVSGEDGLLKTLAQHPVVVAVAAGNNAWKQYQGGVLSACDTTQVDHAVLAVGYDGDTIKIKNSWGDRWGEAGYIRIKRGAGGMGTCGVFTDMSHPLV